MFQGGCCCFSGLVVCVRCILATHWALVSIFKCRSVRIYLGFYLCLRHLTHFTQITSWFGERSRKVCWSTGYLMETQLNSWSPQLKDSKGFPGTFSQQIQNVPFFKISTKFQEHSAGMDVFRTSLLYNQTEPSGNITVREHYIEQTNETFPEGSLKGLTDVPVCGCSESLWLWCHCSLTFVLSLSTTQWSQKFCSSQIDESCFIQKGCVQRDFIVKGKLCKVRCLDFNPYIP